MCANIFNLNDIPKIKEKENKEITNLNIVDDEKVLKLKDSFENSRCSVSSKITEYSNLLKEFDNLINLSVDLYSYRQLIAEDRFRLYEQLVKIDKTIKNKSRESLFNLKKLDIVLSQKNEKEIIINSDLSDISYKHELILNHINFLDSSIKNLDNLIWGVKLRVEIEKIKNGIV